MNKTDERRTRPDHSVGANGAGRELALWPLWAALGVLGLGLLVFLSLTPLPHHVLHFTFGDKLEHIAAFACVQAWFSQLYVSRRRRLILLLVFMVVALALELGQRLIGGYPELEWGDVLASWCGLLLAAWAMNSARADGFLRKLELKLLLR